MKNSFLTAQYIKLEQIAVFHEKIMDNNKIQALLQNQVYVNFDGSGCKVGLIALVNRASLTLQSHKNCIVPQ